MGALATQKNAIQFKNSSTPKLMLGHPYFLGRYLGKLLLPKGSVNLWHQMCPGFLASPEQASEPLWTSEPLLIRERGKMKLTGGVEDEDGLMTVLRLGSIEHSARHMLRP